MTSTRRRFTAGLSVLACAAAVVAVVLEWRCAGGRSGPTLGQVYWSRQMGVTTDAGSRTDTTRDRLVVGFWDGRLTG